MSDGKDGEFMQRKRAKVEIVERGLLHDYLVRAEWNVSLACRLAGMHRSAFQRLLAKHGMKVPELRTAWEAKREAARQEAAAEMEAGSL